MKYFLVQFRAEYYCQGYEWSTFQRLIRAESFEEAVGKLQNDELELINKKDFKDLTIQ